MKERNKVQFLLLLWHCVIVLYKRIFLILILIICWSPVFSVLNCMISTSGQTVSCWPSVSVYLHSTFQIHGIIPCFMSSIRFLFHIVPILHSRIHKKCPILYMQLNSLQFFDRNTVAVHKSSNILQTIRIRFYNEYNINKLCGPNLHITQYIVDCSQRIHDNSGVG